MARSTASTSSRPSPRRCPSYQRAASSSSAEASGSGRTVPVIARSTAGQRARARPPTVHRPIRRSSHVGPAVRFRGPTQLRLPRHSPPVPRRGWPATPRRRRPVLQRATSTPLEEVLALGTSCSHSRLRRAAQQAAAPDGCVLFVQPLVSRDVIQAGTKDLSHLFWSGSLRHSAWPDASSFQLAPSCLAASRFARSSCPTVAAGFCGGHRPLRPAGSIGQVAVRFTGQRLLRAAAPGRACSARGRSRLSVARSGRGGPRRLIAPSGSATILSPPPVKSADLLRSVVEFRRATVSHSARIESGVELILRCTSTWPAASRMQTYIVLTWRSIPQ